MNINDFAYSKSTTKGFEDAVVAVLQQVEKKGWSVFSIYDLQERLAAKGFRHEKMKIVEVCSAKHADKFLRKNQLVSLCMPCKINVLEQGSAVRIVGMRPAMLSQFFDEISPEETAIAEADIKDIVDWAA